MRRSIDLAVLRKPLPKALLADITDFLRDNFLDEEVRLGAEPIIYCCAPCPPDNEKQSIHPHKRVLIESYTGAPVKEDGEFYDRCLPLSEPLFLKRGKLEDVVSHLDDTFQQRLLHLIDESGKSDVDIYKKADITRQNFCKIRSNTYYMPKKNTAIRLALALELNIDKTNDLLRRAGYALSNSRKADVIVRYFIENNTYSLVDVNQAIYQFCDAKDIL